MRSLWLMNDSIRPPNVMLKSTVTLEVDSAREALRKTRAISTDSPASQPQSAWDVVGLLTCVEPLTQHVGQRQTQISAGLRDGVQQADVLPVEGEHLAVVVEDPKRTLESLTVLGAKLFRDATLACMIRWH